MSTLDNMGAEFANFNRYLDTIIDPREADNDSLEAKVKEAIVQAYSNGYHDGQEAMYKRLPKPSPNGGEQGGLDYYDSL
jgi:acetaldehyde dehydrogenase (acetylating)